MTADIERETTRNGVSWQFSLRTIFLLTLAAATLAALARVAAQLDVLVLGLTAPVWSMRTAMRCWRTRRRLSAITFGHLVAAWCALYVVLVGPAVVLAARYQWAEPLLLRLYAPLEWLFSNAPSALAGALEWYLVFWWGLG